MSRRHPFKYSFSAFLRGFGVIVLFLGVAYVAAILDDPAYEPGSGAAGPAYAIDGDTLDITSRRIRLLEIDAPELDQFCTNRQGVKWPCGVAAREAMVDMIAGLTVTCTGDNQDRYRRLLAVCRTPEGDVGAALVSQGLAIGGDSYLVEQIKARREGLGIWSGEFDTPREWRNRQKVEDTGGTGFMDWLLGLLLPSQ